MRPDIGLTALTEGYRTPVGIRSNDVLGRRRITHPVPHTALATSRNKEAARLRVRRVFETVLPIRNEGRLEGPTSSSVRSQAVTPPNWSSDS